MFLFDFIEYLLEIIGNMKNKMKVFLTFPMAVLESGASVMGGGGK